MNHLQFVVRKQRSTKTLKVAEGEDEKGVFMLLLHFVMEDLYKDG